MKINKIMPAIWLSALGLVSCTENPPTKINVTPVQKDTVEEVLPTPLTQDFLGMHVEYKSKEDSINAVKYIKQIVLDALPYEKRYNRKAELDLNLSKKRLEFLQNGDTLNADSILMTLNYVDRSLDSLWQKLSSYSVNTDSINKYTKKSDFESGKTYLYIWFKEEILKK